MLGYSRPVAYDFLMLLYLFLLFTVIPIIELSVLIWIGGQTHWWVPVLLVITTGILGAALARWQGWQVLQRIRADAASGRMPADAMIDAFLILLAAILLIMPGVVSDVLGVLLLIPPARVGVKRLVSAWIKRKIEVRVTRATTGYQSGPTSNSSSSRRDEIIDARVINTRVEDV